MRVRQERTGWRDLRLNDRHRLWGWDCPATDIDEFVEYDNGKAAALIEYKNEYAQVVYPTNTNRRALVDVCDRARLPCFGVRYADNFAWWRITPLNDEARRVITGCVQMSEREYVAFLYKLRGREAPADVLERVSDVTGF